MGTSIKEPRKKPFTATRNACKMCTPLGACVAFKGIRNCIPLIHGSQGCSTYIRRYMISHYKEPVDIASTNFTEEAAVFGGERNFEVAVNNIISQYNPEVIAIASTCLSETIGDDLEKIVKTYQRKYKDEKLPRFVFASTPSYIGTHMDGFHTAVSNITRQLAQRSSSLKDQINVFPGFLSTEDLRIIKQILTDFDVSHIMVSDYSDTLDNPNWDDYKKMPYGGTGVEQLESVADSYASIEFGRILKESSVETTAEYLHEKFAIPCFSIGLPIGIKETDRFFDTLSTITGKTVPDFYKKQRGRLIDAYVDAHKYVFGKKAVVYGEEDFVVAMVSFLEEIGIDIVLCASGGKSQTLKKVLTQGVKIKSNAEIIEGVDFEEIAKFCKEQKPDIMIGNSKGYYISRKLDIPLIRVGFPIHDRVGGQRIAHLSYSGTQQLFDKIANAIIEKKQDSSPVGYKYM